jgi:hypothetical protein
MPPVTNPGELFQTRNSGGSWALITSFTAQSNVGPTAIAPANANNVAVMDGANAVYVSTSALALPATNITFTNITGNLPNRAVVKLAFDPNDRARWERHGEGASNVFRFSTRQRAKSSISVANLTINRYCTLGRLATGHKLANRYPSIP